MNSSLVISCLVVLFLAINGAQAQDYPMTKADRAKVVEAMLSGVDGEDVKLPWRLFVPPQSAQGEALPLVVFLHGAGRRGTDNIGAMELAWTFFTPEAQAAHPCFILAGQVAQDNRWVDHKWQDGSYRLADVPISDEMRLLLARVRQCIAEQPIDPDRVYVVGQSMGGFGAWDALLRAPDIWAAGIPICGGGSPEDAASIAHIPVWAWHGDKDTSVPVSGTREMIAALKQAGATPKYTEIPNGGHGAWMPAFADPELYAWLFAQRRQRE